MPLPNSRNTTYGDRTVIKADDLNALQDAVVTSAHGPIEVPLDLTQRISVAGSWSIGSGGALTEASNTGVCRVPITVPTGSVISSVRVRGQQTGTTDIFQCQLQQNSGTGSGASPVGSGGSSDGVTTGVQQDAIATPNHTTLTNTRYFCQIFTTGGGVGNRIITGAYVTISRA